MDINRNEKVIVFTLHYVSATRHKTKSLSAGHIRGQSISSLKVNDKQEGRYETLMVSFDQHKYRNSHSASIVF